MELSAFRKLLIDKTGLSFDEMRTAILTNGILRRMHENSISSEEEYLRLIRRSEGEFLKLVNSLTVKETFFFREPNQLRVISEILIPLILRERKDGAKVKILSAGCSTGEEPYSLSIGLYEKYGENFSSMFSISAVDIDGDALKRAEAGVFGAQSFRNTSHELREKYFEKAGRTKHLIKESVRKGVSFRRLNLLGSPYPEELTEMDVIFYRNVSIYFSSEIQKKIFGNLSAALKDRGYLLTSSTETLTHNFYRPENLSLIETGGVFLFRKTHDSERPGTQKPREEAGDKPAPKTPHEVFPAEDFTKRLRRKAAPEAALPHEKTSGVMKKSALQLFEDALCLTRAKDYGSALKIIDGILEETASFTKAHSLRANILVNLNRLDEAEVACIKLIEADRWSLEAYLILGLIERMRGDDDASIRRFKEALYVKSSCWLAHYYMAEIYLGRGETETARREYSIIIRLLEKNGISEPGVTFFPFSFSQNEMLTMCRHKLAGLKKRPFHA